MSRHEQTGHRRMVADEGSDATLATDHAAPEALEESDMGHAATAELGSDLVRRGDSRVTTGPLTGADLEALFDQIRADERDRIYVSVVGVRRSLAHEYDPAVVQEIIGRITEAIVASSPQAPRRAIEAAPRGRHAAPDTTQRVELPVRRPMAVPNVVATPPVAPVHRVTTPATADPTPTTRYKPARRGLFRWR